MVLVGKHNVDISEPGEQRIIVEKFIRHPSYDNLYPQLNDYSLLKLENSINLNLPHVKIVCLPINTPDVTDGLNMTVCGWGRTDPNNNRTRSHVLKALSVVTISNTECQNFFDTRLSSSNLCVWGMEKDSNPCHGDSGGKLFSLFTLEISI